jgi:2'-5' RNA ligase
MDSASFEGSRVGRLREEKGRIRRERKRVWIILNAIDGFSQLAKNRNQVFWIKIAERGTSIRRLTKTISPVCFPGKENKN